MQHFEYSLIIYCILKGNFPPIKTLYKCTLHLLYQAINVYNVQ